MEASNWELFQLSREHLALIELVVTTHWNKDTGALNEKPRLDESFPPSGICHEDWRSPPDLCRRTYCSNRDSPLYLN